MLINVLDVNLQKVAFLSNDVPGLPNYYDDEFHEYRDQGAATFKFTVKKVINNKLQSYARFLNGQSYFSFQIDGNDYLMTPASEQAIHETSEEVSFFCVSLDRELMSEQANPLVNTSSHNIQWYFDQMGLISNTQITIGINEVSNLTRTINYDGQETKLARLISVIGNFDAEFEFITKLNNDGSLDSVTLNIYKENDGLDIQGVGKKRDDVRLIFGENIQAVERDVSTEGFLNATTVTGADNLSWKSASFSYTNDDGVEEFYKRAGDNTAYAPLSAKIYPAQLSKDKDDIWTRIDFTTEYKNVNDMWAYAVRQFKQYAYHQVTYTVTPSSKLVNAEIGDGPPLAKGDTVIIQDNNYIDIDGNVGLLLSARVSEKIVSETHPENNKLIFSNFKKQQSEASADIQAIVNQLVDAATPYIGSISTTNGTQFKNGTGSTTLSAHIYKGSATTETIADSYEWSKDGTVVANAQTITVDASGVVDKAVYSFKATVGGKVVGSQSVTITNVDDGIAGKTSYTHVAYANSADGTDGFTTVYPNLNLLKNTKSQSYTSTGTAENISSNTYPLDGVIADILNKPLTITYNYAITNSSGTWSGTIRPTYGLGGTNQSVSNANLSGTHKETITLAGVGFNSYRIVTSGLPAGTTVTITNLKVEFGSIATPYMPSVTEVKTSDYPSYIGTYSDDKISDSTKSTDYTWSLIRGNDGVSPINLIIESSNGYQFKNNIINTTFTAILYQNNKEIDSDGTKFAYIWSKTNSDGTVDTAWNLAHQTSRKSITITNSDVWQRATFDCTAEPLN
ncbi:MAG: phage tail protein [Lactococcus lactis]